MIRRDLALLAAVFLAVLSVRIGYAQTPSETLYLPGTEAGKLFRLAGELYEQKRYPAAAKHYQDFVKKYSKHPRRHEAMMMLAESLYRQALAEAAEQDKPSESVFRDAAKAYDEALRATPRDDLLAESALYRLAEIEFNLKHHEEADKRISKLLSDYPGGLLRGEARMLQAQSLLAMEKAQDAVQLLAAILQDQPRYEEDPRFQLVYGIALFSVGNSSGALGCLERPDLDLPLAHLYAGRSLLELGKPLVAIEHFLQIRKLDPDGPYVELGRYLSAESFFAAKDYRSAIHAYEQFLKDYPRSPLRPGAMFKIGFSQYELGEYLAARGSFQSVLQLAGKSEFASLSLYMTAESFMKEKRLKEAGFAYDDMASSYEGPLAGNAQFKLAWTHLKLGDLTAAETAAKTMLIKHPSHPLAPVGALLLGNILTHHKQYSAAVIAYQRALDMLPDSGMSAERKTEIREACLALLSRANLLGKDYGRLVSGYRYILEEIKPTLHPWRAATMLFIAEGYYRQGLYDEALGIYREIVKSFPANPDSAYAVDGIAWCLFKKGEYKEAEAERRKLEDYRLKPKVAPSKTVLVDEKIQPELFTTNEYETATSRFNQKKYLEAMEAYENFEKAHPSHPLAAEAALQMGWCTYRLEYYGQAIKIWERVETTYPQNKAAAKAAWATADTYFRAGQYEKAIVVYRRILSVYTDDPALTHARLRIAQSYYNGREVLKAIGAFENLLRTDPESPEASQVLEFLTQLLYREDAKQQALDALERVAAERPFAPMAARARFRIARHHFEGRDFAQAVKLFEPIMTRLTEAGELADAQYMLAESYYNLQRYKDAAWAYDRFTTNYASDERYVPALFHLGASDFKLEDYEGAAKAFQTIYKNHPKSSHAPVALFNSALAYRKLGKWESAALALKAYAREYPEAAKNSNAMSELLAVYEEHHQYAAAVDVIRKVRDSLPADDAKRLELTYRLGENLMSMEKESEAIEAFRSLMKSALKQDPFRLSGLAKLGEYYEGKEQWAEALGVYEELSRSAVRGDWAEAAKARAANAREKLKAAAEKEAPPPAKPSEEKTP